MSSTDEQWITIRITVDFGWVGTTVSETVQFDREEWDGMDAGERDSAVQESIDEIITSRVSAGWEVEGE